MHKKILVPMRRNDRPEDFIPYVEKVARPGMKVVFMVPYPLDGFRWSHAEFGRKMIEEAKRLVNYYSWDANLQKAKDRISRASRSLTVTGIELDVDLYAGSIRKAVRDHTAKNDVQMIVTRTGIGERIAAVLNGSNSVSDLFKRPALSAVLLIYPGLAAKPAM